MNLPPLPPGFVLDEPQQGMPPLPPGFQLDDPSIVDLPAVRAQVAPEDRQWGSYFPETPRPGILETARATNPALADVPDNQLAAQIRQEFYPNMPAAEFYRSSGLAERLGLPDDSPLDPTEGMSNLDIFRAGMGRGLVDIGRGARQLAVEGAALAGSDRARNYARQLRREESERSQRDAPLMRRGAAMAGYAGSLIGPLGGAGFLSRGSLAAGAFAPTSMAGSAAQGAAIGALQPVGEEDSRLRNAGFGGAAGAAGQAIGSRISRWTPGARDAMREADRLGVNLRAEPGAQVRQLSSAARQLVPESRGDAFIDIQQGVRNAHDEARRGVNSAYDAARASRATVPMSEVSGFAQNARRNLAESGFDLQAMPGVTRRLDELDQLAATPNAREAQLRGLEQWRKRVTAMSPRDGGPEMAAATALRRQYDDTVADMFNRDMVSGDANALKAWRDARAASAAMHSTFSANTVVRNLARNEDMTPETMRSWLFNASGVGAKSQAGAVVRRLNGILGQDSPQMGALRAEVVADLSEPLLQRTPNIRGFLDRYDTYFRRNPTLARELFPGGVGDLQQLQMFARGIERRPGARISPDSAPDQRTLWGPLGRLLTAKMFGHGIAEGGARMAAARGWIDRVRGMTVGSQARKNILREYLGTDPRQPLFPRGPGTAGGVLSASITNASAESGEPDGSYPGP